MKKGKYVLIIFLIFFFLIVATFLSFLYFEFGAKPVEVRTRSYLEINLSGEIQELFEPDFFSSFFFGIRPLSVNDLWMNIRKAKVDSRISSILLRLSFLNCNWGKISELRDALLDFRQSGKKVFAYIEEAPQFDKEYYLATACDQIILHPLGWLGINGIGGYVPFFKKAFDQLGIQAEFEHVEEYKTAYNMFTEEGFTPAHREMMESIYGDLFSQYVKTVAQARKKSEGEVKKLIDQGFYQGEEAKNAGLVDDVLFEDQLLKLLKEKGGSTNKISYDEYSKVSPSSLGLDIGRRIGLIYGMGPILSGEGVYQTIGSTSLSRWIRAAREDKSIAAIVMRVDSPGGSAVASDVIWREIALAKKEKPFIVSMSDVAGSGGYWISMSAHKIVAQPQTLTGSIGVLSGKFNMAGLYKKLGITAEKLTYGKEADIFSSFRGLTPEEKIILKKQILWIYDKFLTKVAEGRNMPKEEVNKIGKGRVWTGSQAKDLKLVDELGGLSVAIKLAKELAGIAPKEEVKLVVWPKRVSFFQALFGRRAAAAKLNLSSNLDKAISIIKLLENERIWAVMPFWLDIE